MGPTTAAVQSGSKQTTPSSRDDGLSAVLFGNGHAAAAAVAAAEDDAGEDDDGLDDESADIDAGSDENAATAGEGLDDDEGDDSDDDTTATGAADEAGAEGEDDEEDAGADEDEDEDEENPAAKQARAKFTPEQQALFNKAMKKERARRNSEVAALQERLAQLEKQATVGAASAAAPAPTADDPLADVQTEAELEQRIAGAKAWRQWLRLHPDGGTVGEGDNAKDVTPEQARAWLVHYEDILLEHAPARRAQLAKRQAADSAALKVHPWLAKASDPRTLAVEAELRAHPALRSVPGVRALIADAHLTRAARQAALKKGAAAAGGATTGKTAGAARAPHNPAAGATRPPKASQGKAAAKAVQTLHQTGDDPGNAVLGNALFPGGRRS